MYSGRQRPAVRNAAGLPTALSDQAQPHEESHAGDAHALHARGDADWRVALWIQESRQGAGGQVATLDQRLPGHRAGGGQPRQEDAGDRGDGPEGGFLGSFDEHRRNGQVEILVSAPTATPPLPHGWHHL